MTTCPINLSLATASGRLPIILKRVLSYHRTACRILLRVAIATNPGVHFMSHTMVLMEDAEMLRCKVSCILREVSESIYPHPEPYSVVDYVEGLGKVSEKGDSG